MPVIIPPPSSSGEGVYSNKSNLESFFGEKNIAAWSSLDPNPDEANDVRIDLALALADTTIIGAFPFEPPVNAVTTRWATVIAGVDLYRSHGTTGDDPYRFDDLLVKVNREMAMYLCGERSFANSPETEIPAVIVE